MFATINYNGQTAAHPDSPWVFRGYRPGTHLTPTHLRTRLRPVLAALEARLGTINELTQTTRVAHSGVGVAAVAPGGGVVGGPAQSGFG